MRCAARGRHHRAPPPPALPAAPHPRARALRRILRVCNFDAAGTRALPQDQPVAPLSPSDLVLDALCDFRDVHFGTPANEDRRPLRVSRITVADKEPSESARAVRLPQCAHRARVPAASRVPAAAAAVTEVRVPLVPERRRGADALTAQQSSSASCTNVALDMGAYVRSREALLPWSMPDTKELVHYAECSFGWQQSKLESVLHPVLRRVREWRERGLMGRGQMRERTDDANANSCAPLTQLSITAFATHVQTPCSTNKNALSLTTN